METKSVEQLSKPAKPEQREQREPDIGQNGAGLYEGDRPLEERLQAIEEQMATQGVQLTNEDLDGLRSYLATEKQWEEVYRRLAES